MKEFAQARRRITSDGVRALVEAVGKDLRELGGLQPTHRGHRGHRR